MMGTFITVTQLAELLGVSRQTIFKRIKKGEIEAEMVGKTYAIKDEVLSQVLGKEISDKRKKQIDQAIHKIVSEHGEVLEKLSYE